MITLTNRQARQFLLRIHGLLGDYRFTGASGVCEYVRQSGCIQFDPVDACGKNAELVLQSRIQGFTKEMLADLLYRDRLLFDYPDKNIAILSVEDWPYFSRYREQARLSGLQFEGLDRLEETALRHIEEHGPVSSATLPVEGEIFWHSAIHWSGNWHKPSNAARSVLEQLYSTGQLVIHHKEGSRKFYDLAERHIPEALLNAADPLPDEFDHLKWRILRRIGAVGLLWNRSSDAWLNIQSQQSARLDSGLRNAAFTALLEEEKIAAVSVEGLRDVLYCRTADLPLLDEILQGTAFPPRCELLAPLDCLLWDRKLLKAIFGFDYTWEIYTPAEKRKFGYYVLPILYGDRFVGRTEATADPDAGILTVRKIWYEEDVRPTVMLQRRIHARLRRLAKFNHCRTTVLPE